MDKSTVALLVIMSGSIVIAAIGFTAAYLERKSKREKSEQNTSRAARRAHV